MQAICLNFHHSYDILLFVSGLDSQFPALSIKLLLKCYRREWSLWSNTERNCVDMKYLAWLKERTIFVVRSVFLCLLFQWQHILHNMFVRRVHWSSGLTHIKGYVCNGCAPLKNFTTCVDLIPDLCWASSLHKVQNIFELKNTACICLICFTGTFLWFAQLFRHKKSIWPALWNCCGAIFRRTTALQNKLNCSNFYY